MADLEGPERTVAERPAQYARLLPSRTYSHGCAMHAADLHHLCWVAHTRQAALQGEAAARVFACLALPPTLTRETCAQTLEGHDALVVAVAVLPDGRAVTGSGDGTARVWDTSTGKCDLVLEGHDARIVTLAVTLPHVR